MVDQALAVARRLVMVAFWPVIETVAEILGERGRLRGRQTMRIVLRQR